MTNQSKILHAICDWVKEKRVSQGIDLAICGLLRRGTKNSIPSQWKLEPNKDSVLFDYRQLKLEFAAIGGSKEKFSRFWGKLRVKRELGGIH